MAYKQKGNNSKQDIMQYIESLFEECGISGIINIPGIGTITMYSNLEGKLKILEHVQVELKSEEILRELKSQSRAVDKLHRDNQEFNISSKNRNYIG
jgi:hypothetical protein